MPVNTTGEVKNHFMHWKCRDELSEAEYKLLGPRELVPSCLIYTILLCKSIMRFLTTIETLAHFLPGHTEQLFKKGEYPHTHTHVWPLNRSMGWGLVLWFSVFPGRWLPEQDSELGNGAELSQEGKISPSDVWYSRVFLDAREGFPLLAVPLHGHVQLKCWAWSMSGQACSRLVAAGGVGKGNVIKERDLGKQTGYIY